MSKVEVFAKRDSKKGSVTTLIKIGWLACRGIDTLEPGEERLLHVQSHGSDSLRRAVNDAYAEAVAKGYTEVAEDLKGSVIAVNK